MKEHPACFILCILLIHVNFPLERRNSAASGMGPLSRVFLAAIAATANSCG